MDGGGVEEELERRSRFLSSLIQKKKESEQHEQLQQLNVRVRAADMPIPLQNRAFRCARESLDAMMIQASGDGGNGRHKKPGHSKLDSKRLALALKKVKQPALIITPLGLRARPHYNALGSTDGDDPQGLGVSAAYHGHDLGWIIDVRHQLHRATQRGEPVATKWHVTEQEFDQVQTSYLGGPLLEKKKWGVISP
ncbi:hypothetical protein ACLOJK_007145 [Asimina triloba]